MPATTGAKANKCSSPASSSLIPPPDHMQGPASLLVPTTPPPAHPHAVPSPLTTSHSPTQTAGLQLSEDRFPEASAHPHHPPCSPAITARCRCSFGIVSKEGGQRQPQCDDATEHWEMSPGVRDMQPGGREWGRQDSYSQTSQFLTQNPGV